MSIGTFPTLVHTNHPLWFWDSEFAGKIDLPFIPATGTVPDTVPGHVSYSSSLKNRARAMLRLHL